jgi:glycosyltransferase involved in cell wall biosynthesis
VIHLFINALAANAGGGLTYVRNILPILASAPVRTTVLISPNLRQEFADLRNIDFIELNILTFRRFWYEQSNIPELVRRSGADVLVSTGNFAVKKSPVPQILLSRNSIYTSADYLSDLKRRHEYRTLADTYFRAMIAKRSIHWADVTVAPSEAFAVELRRWTGAEVISIHHGFDREAFTGNSSPLSAEVEAKLDSLKGAFKLLFVSHYNYYRNFETLIQALPALRQRFPQRGVRLLLTCKLAAGMNPGLYRPDSAANLVKTLGVSDMVIELGAIPYGQLHQLYAQADLYVTPAYTETFAHPLVEAMSSGLPIVASDIAVHREICGDAAVYFDRFSVTELAQSVSEVADSPEIMNGMATTGTKRSEMFSWRSHVHEIVELCYSLTRSTNGLGTRHRVDLGLH